MLRMLSFLALVSPADAQEAGFSPGMLQAKVRDLASKPYQPHPLPLDDYWRRLDYDQHRDIRFRMEHGLWAGAKLPFSIDFFHPGWTAKEMVDIHEVADGATHKLRFDRSLFDYGKQRVPDAVPAPGGYAGWRARCHLNSPDYMDEFLVFLGASYFRAIPAHSPYGLSARGLSINSGIPGVPEEFPVFTEWHLKKPAPGDRTMTAWAVLDSESVAGFYQFTITPGTETVMDVEAEITLRKPVRQLGIAPFSSMFWFGEGTHPRPLDFRPEVHDSDGLRMELEHGHVHFRPLENSRHRIRHCEFRLERPRSWSLVQRDRAFASYEDPEARYHERPSVTVEPRVGMEAGKLHLIELPAHDETEDNIVLAWEPGQSPEPGRPHAFSYRLRWQQEAPASRLFEVRATRVGTPVRKPDELLIVVDFAKPLHPVKKDGEPPVDDAATLRPVVHIGHADVKPLHVGLQDVSALQVDGLAKALDRSTHQMPQVLRAFFVIDPGKAVEQLDMTCELQDASGNAVSERWTYLWVRPR